MNADTRATQDVIRLLLSASANAALYSREHPQVLRLGRQLHDTVSATLEGADELSLMVIENELIVNGRPQETSLFLSRFSQILKGRGIEHVRILRGVTREELDAFILSLAATGPVGDLESSDHLRLGHLDLRLATGAAPQGREDAILTPGDRLADLTREEVERFSEIYDLVRRRRKLKITGIMDIVSGFVEVFRQEGRPLLVLAALRENDEYTFTHSTNVCILNLAQAMALGIQGQQLKDIGVAAMLHDIGKLFVPEEIITKKSGLTGAEFAIMKEHPVTGARYLMETPGVPRLAAIAAYEHHAKFDLSGYPHFPRGWRLNFSSHLTMISDFFDATRTRRSYREPLSLDQITSLMLGMAGTELHPVLTRNLLHILYNLKNPS